MKQDQKKKGGISTSFATGAVALVFLIVGFQVALFLNRAALSKIASTRETPDTVYIVEAPAPAGEAVPVKVAPERHSGSHPSVVSAPAERTYRSGGKTRGSPAVKRRVESFKFNPNEATVEDFVRLGFSEKQAQSIINYRQKGGRFRRKGDFAKSFVVSDSIFRRLEPYIDIPRLDLNAADSAAFDDLPGIGGYFASQMVSFRERLGGYSYKEQLLDIYRFDGEKFSVLEDLVEVREETATPFPLWSASEEVLARHPYIGRQCAHSVILYRENTPPEKWSVEDLASTGILKPEMASKLSKCIIKMEEFYHEEK